MGKKSVKRKTRWRTLSITESVDGNSPESAGNSTNTSNIGEAVSLNESFRNYSSNYSYLQRKSFDSSKSFGSDNRNSFSNTNSYYHNKYNNGTLTSASSKYGHRRRPLSYQNGSSRYYSSYWDSRAGNRNSRPSTFSDKENISTKPRFNEDEYTRITTPRQDVIFKKGYLSQPKRYLSSTDTYTTSSAAASVISTEESMSATSVPSLSPEQCSSHADSMDPEQAIMYSYFDQNGVLYVGPYMPNGFDQYSGQMFMLPYACPPYISPPDIISPSLSVDMEENQSTNTTDTNENEKNEKKDEESIQETTDESKELSENCDPKPDASDDKAEDNCIDEKDENNESKEDKKEEEKLENKKVNNDAFYNYGYQQYYPPMFFPYVYGPPFMPVFGNDYETSNECFEEEEDDELPKHKRKERDRVHSDQNSTGATTTDYSEDDSGKEEISDPQESLLPETTCTESTQPGLIPNDETENKQIIFNANVEEFVPRTVKSRFNVHVKEFLPRRYKLKENISTEEATSKREKSPENLKPSNDSQKSKETHSISEISIDITADKSPSSVNAAIVVQKKDLTIKKQLEKPSPKPRPTLADKIKKRLASEPKQILFQQTNPPKSTIEQANKKKVLKTNAYATPKSSLSYAQMLSKNGKQNAKVTVSNATIAAPEPAKQQCIDDEKDKLNQSQSETPTTNNSVSASNSEWTTVKPRGKRAKHFKEVPIEELSIDDVIVVEDNEPPQETLEVSKNIIETPAEVKEEKKEPEIEPPVEIVTEESSPQVSAVKDVKKKTKKSKKTSTKKQTTSTSHKKAKDISFAEINIKTELKDLENNELTLTSESAAELDQDDDIYAKDVALLSARNSSDENLSLNNIHSLDSKKFLFGKSFGCNPLNLNGFDYKLKGKQILKEEEEMVLSVIKSLSTNQSKQFDNKISDKSNGNSEEALEAKQNGINEIQRNITNSIITNGFSAEHETIAPNSEPCDTSDNEAIEDSKEPPEEEVDEDTIILYMNEEYVNNKSVSNEKLELSENDSVSDLSSDESDQKLIEKNELNDNETLVTDCVVNEIDCAVNKIDFNNSESKSMPRDLPPETINSDEKNESEMEVVGICNGNTSEESEEQVLEETIDEEQITELNSFNSVNEQLPNLETILINKNETPYSEYIYKEENLDDNHSIEFNHNGMHSVTTSTPESKDSQKVSTTLKDQLEEIENQLKKLGSITPRTLSKETLEDPTPVSILTNDETETLNISKNEVEISCNGTFNPTENCDQSLSSIPMQCENINETIEDACQANIENILQVPFNEFVSPDNKLDQEIPTSIATCGDAKDNVKCDEVELTTSFNEVKHSMSSIEFPSTESSSNQTNRSFSDTTLRSSDNTEEHIDYPLTTAVKQWLNEVSKENTPEPIFRIPSDPKLTSIIKSSITQQKDFENIEADWISDESDDDNLNENPKNLKSNPSHVSSVSRRSKRRLVFYHTDNDSDYNSDSQNKYDDDNNTCERVAQNASDITNSDFLDYWDDEFIRNPKKWLRVSRSTSIERESILSTTSSELAPYDSVYGKSIDYNRLLANNYEFLSNNILSFNNKQNTNADIHETLIHAKNDTLLTNNNNFDNKHYDKENCLKPPEVCCILM